MAPNINWDTQLSKQKARPGLSPPPKPQNPISALPRKVIPTKVYLQSHTYGAVAYLQQGTQSAILTSKSRATLLPISRSKGKLMTAVIDTRHLY